VSLRVVVSPLAEEFLTSLTPREWRECHEALLKLTSEADPNDVKARYAGFPYAPGTAARVVGNWVFYYSLVNDTTIGVARVYYSPRNPKHPFATDS